MAEDSAEQESNDELIAGLEEGDLKPNFYEGGFKTWECALDLARLVADEDLLEFFSSDDSYEGSHIIEVCAVSAWPFFFFFFFLLTVVTSLVQGLQSRLWRCSRSYYRDQSLCREIRGRILLSQTITRLFSVSSLCRIFL